MLFATLLESESTRECDYELLFATEEDYSLEYSLYEFIFCWMESDPSLSTVFYDTPFSYQDHEEFIYEVFPSMIDECTPALSPNTEYDYEPLFSDINSMTSDYCYILTDQPAIYA